MYKITNANIKEWAKNYDGELFDGILCDPPYELGFMGKSWDSSGIAFDSEMWADIFKLLKPGGHLLAFSGSRTYHRMAVAIEDAGFEIRDQLIWMYGSGFPKSLNIGKAVDKIQGNEREQTTNNVTCPDFPNPCNGHPTANRSLGGGANRHALPTKGTSEWEGYGTALKPAHEPCVLARKPIDGTVANNVLKHGTGGLNIDGTRVTTDENLNGGMYSGTGKAKTVADHKWGFEKRDGQYTQPTGRFPANLIHDGSDEVEVVFPQTTSKGHAPKLGKGNPFGGDNNREQTESYFNDSGSASRFFFSAKPDLYCSLCYGIIEVCENNAQNVQTTSQLGTQASNTAQNNVVVKQAQEPKDKPLNKTNNAHNAVNGSASINQTIVNTAQPNVTQNQKRLADLLVKYVGNQCLKCSISTAQNLAATLASGKTVSTGQQTQTLLWLNGLTHELLLNIVIEINSLAKYAENQTEELNDTTQIIRNLKKLYGSVNRTISESTQARFKYQSKASKRERNAGLEGFEEKITNDGRKTDIDNAFQRGTTLRSNSHPTVKPLSLTKYLATLIKPPTGGRLLVPFSGSGSEMIGALQAGWEYVEGVELTEEYIPIAEARIKYWLSVMAQEDAKPKQVTLV